LAEVLDHFDMETYRGAGVAVCYQILDERDEDYGKVVGCYSLAGKSALENLLDDSETRNALGFQGPAPLPPAPYCRQMQTQNDFTEGCNSRYPGARVVKGGSGGN